MAKYSKPILLIQSVQNIWSKKFKFRIKKGYTLDML